MARGKIMFPISLSMVKFCLGWIYTDLVQGLITTAMSSCVVALAVCWRHNSYAVNSHLWLFNFLSPLPQLFLSLWVEVGYKCSLQEY